MNAIQSLETKIFNFTSIANNFISMSKDPCQYSVESWESLLRNGTNPNITDKKGFAPIHYLLRNSRNAPISKIAPIIEILIRSGADCNLSNNIEETAIGLICGKEWDEFPKLRELAVQQVIDSGVELSSLSYYGKPLLLALAKSPSIYSAKSWELLLRNGANPNITDKSGFAPIHYLLRNTRNAPISKIAPIIEILIKSGADCNLSNNIDETAIGLICGKVWDEFPRLRELAVKQIKDSGVEISSLSYCGKPILLELTEHPNAFSKLSLRCLFKHGVLPNLMVEKLEERDVKKRKIDCELNTELKKHKIHFENRPLEYRCICAVVKYSNTLNISCLPSGLKRNIAYLFYD